MSSEYEQLDALGKVPRLTNEQTLLVVPTRHARRAELAVVLAELAEAVVLADDEVGYIIHPRYAMVRPVAWSERAAGFSRRGGRSPVVRLEGYQLVGLSSGEVRDLGALGAADPLEAARLALAAVRGEG